MYSFVLGDQYLVLQNDEQPVGRVDFQPGAHGAIDVYHIGVDPSMRGQNLGQKLLDEICRIAREKDQTIIPTCPYAQKMLERHPERYSDVIKK